MTAVTASPPQAGEQAPRSAGTAADPTLRQRFRRYRVIAGVVLIVLVIAVISTLIGTPGHQDDLDPRSYAPTGTHALAALLDQRDVHVEVETSVAAAQTQAGSNTTLVVANPDRLDDSQLATLAAVPTDLVVIGAGPLELGALDLGVHPGGSAFFDTATVAPQCSLQAAVTAGPIAAGPDAYEEPDDGVGCYPVADGYALVSVARGGRQVTLLGDGTPLTNGQLAKQGNAALALGLLDAHPGVVWLAPPLLASASGTTTRPSLVDLLPSRLKWALLQLVIAVVLLALWRGRRLGRLVPEALPVVVRQAETVVGRARLYRRARSYDQAADALRSGTRDRLARRLGFAPGTGHDGLAVAISARLHGRDGRGVREVETLLYGPAPADDRALVELARALETLEQEVVQP